MERIQNIYEEKMLSMGQFKSGQLNKCLFNPKLLRTIYYYYYFAFNKSYFPIKIIIN